MQQRKFQGSLPFRLWFCSLFLARFIVRLRSQRKQNIKTQKKKTKPHLVRKAKVSWALVAHACHPSYSQGRDQEITVRSQSGQIVCETLSQKTHHKNRAAGVAQGEGPEFKFHYRKKKKSQDKVKTMHC
jgi:hypothetical protein